MLRIKNLNKSYPNRKLLEKLTLHINTGEVYGLLGRNGEVLFVIYTQC
jgi:ABC-2 type transport system ATP-binding protein